MKTKVVRKPIATWWEVDRYEVKITPLKIVAFTEHTYTYLEDGWYGGAKSERTRRRAANISSEFSVAKAYAVKASKERVIGLREDLRQEQNDLFKWKSLKEPKA